MNILCIPDPNGAVARNKYLALLQKHLVAEGVTYVGGGARQLWTRRYDAVHVHWPEHLGHADSALLGWVKLAIILAGLSWARLRGKPVVWTAHNATAHGDANRASEWFAWWAFAKLARGTILLAGSSHAAVAQHRPWIDGLPLAVIPHGHYRDVVEPLPHKDAARRALGIPLDATVLCHFGTLTSYKGTYDLVDCFTKVDRPDARLLLGGPLGSDLQTGETAGRFDAMVRGDARIVLRKGALSDRDMAGLIRASDLAIFPYRSILNSGSFLYALSCDVPVCGPRMGTLVELEEEVSAKWVRLYKGEASPEFLGDILDALQREPIEDGAKPCLARFDWTPIAAAHRAFFEELM